MKTAKAGDECRVDTVCLRSQQFALCEDLDTGGIDYTDDTSGIESQRPRKRGKAAFNSLGHRLGNEGIQIGMTLSGVRVPALRRMR